MLPPDPFAHRYTELRLIGRGGFGAVYRATDTVMHSEVALKLLNAEFAVDADLRRRFEQEATAARRLNAHPNITIVFDRGEFEGQPFIVMELVEGQALSAFVGDDSLTDAERCALIEQLCAGLHYAHQRSIVHRDIKPGNLIVRDDHDGVAGRTLKILDFGIAKVAKVAHTATGGQWFSKNYVSPEQIAGEEVGPLSDMFATGAVAYELLGGRKAFNVSSANVFSLVDEIKQKIGRDPHQPLLELRPELDPELSSIVDRALAKAPGDRFRDMGEMRRALRGVRERLALAGTSQATVVLRPKAQAALRMAREALQAGDSAAAVAHLEGFDLAAASASEREFIESALAEARRAPSSTSSSTSSSSGRQPAQPPAAPPPVSVPPPAAAKPEPIEQRPGTGSLRGVDARVAVRRARARFIAGARADAMAALSFFDEPEKVADALGWLRAADGAIRVAERGIARGNAAERGAELSRLAAFQDPELVSGRLAELRDLVAAADAADGTTTAEAALRAALSSTASPTPTAPIQVVPEDVPAPRSVVERVQAALRALTPRNMRR